MIEFGALQCVPVSPNCAICPFNDICFAYHHQAQNKLPVKQKKLAVKQRYLHYIVIEQSGRVAMKERGVKDIWQGLYDFLLVETKVADSSPEEWVEEPLLSAMLQKGTLREVPKLYTHILTHQKLNVRFWRLEISSAYTIELPGTLTFYSIDEVESLPKPILIDTFLKDEGFL
jgi:A/G-specific adenine glycosylase